MSLKRFRITPRARQLFRKMRATKDHVEWWSLHGDLHYEVGAKPWQWPCVIGPDETKSAGFAAQYDDEARAVFNELVKT